MKLSSERVAKYRKAGYRIIGTHSAVEVCRWTKSALKGEKNCYKGWFGVFSHRCIQMTPTLDYCNFDCVFCWRIHSKQRFLAPPKWDDPKRIVDSMIEAQRELLSGFGGNPEVTKERFEEANEPKHVAISLDGEPTLYPYLAELLREIKRRRMTSFLVTNGSLPEKLIELIESNSIPSTIYVSLYSTNPEDYLKITNSFVLKPLESVLQSLELMSSFESRGCRTVLRITTVKQLNMKDISGYTKIIRNTKPMFVELKGYTWIGESRNRLKSDNMPTAEELLNFAEKFKMEDYKIKAFDRVSRVVLLSREGAWEKNMELIEKQNTMLGLTKNSLELIKDRLLN